MHEKCTRLHLTAEERIENLSYDLLRLFCMKIRKGYAMKRLLNIAILLLMLGLLGSAGCESWLSPKEAGVKEQGLTSEEFFKEQMRKPLVMAGTPPRDTSIAMDSPMPTGTPTTMGAPTTIGTSDFMDTSMTMGTSA